MRNRSSYGFTLIETLVALVIVGILAAIAAPSWISLINQQRVNAINDAVLRALQKAQQEAKKNKLSYSVSFKTDNTDNFPKFAIYLKNTTPNNNNWQNLGKNLEIKAKQVTLVTYLSGENTASPSVSTTAYPITFDYQGNLLNGASLGSKGLIITVGVPQAANSTQLINSSRRCVKVMTLLGALQTGREDECNAS